MLYIKEPNVQVHLKFFAAIRETLGQGSQTIDTEAATLQALREELIARGGRWAEALAHGRAVRLALDQVMSDESACLREGAEVAFFPPVTGG